MVLSLRLAN
jgi:hypothetical protein